MERAVFGQTAEGKDVERLSFRNGRFHFSVITYGAVLYSYGYDDVNIVLNHATVHDYETMGGFLGAVVGPYANRIAKSEFQLDGTVYHLEANNGRNNLHSGSACVGKMLWTVEGIGESSVTLGLATPDGAGGFPGAHEIMITYSLDADGTLTLSYSMTSTKKCPAALTNHAYFNLNGGEGTVMNHIITVPAEKFVDVDDELIPVAVRSVEGTDFDFRTPTLVGARRNGDYDNSFCLDEGAVVRAEGDKAILEMRTTEPAVQIYTGSGLKGDHVKHAGICFESGRYPDSPNHPEYPQAFTAPGEVLRTSTSYTIKAK